MTEGAYAAPSFHSNGGRSKDLMISLKRYLDSSSRERARLDEDTFQEAFAAALDVYGSALLEMGNCSLDACPGLGEALKHSLAQLTAELSPAINSDELSAHGQKAREQLLGWGRDAARHYQGKAREVKEMLLTMAQAAESVGTRDQRYASQIGAVTERLQAIGSLEDLTEIRASIHKSAAELKTSIERMTEEGTVVLNHLKQQVENYQTRLEEAEKIASRDTLTGAGSRLYVEGQIEKRIECGTQFCVAMVDIDAFKQVNDVYGHLIGDELLKQFAGELRSACRSNDVIGRWGGDEFILLFDSTLEEAEAQTERLRKWVCGNYEVAGRNGPLKLRIDASIGLAAHLPGWQMKDLLAQADAAMYEQKAAAHAKVA